MKPVRLSARARRDTQLIATVSRGEWGEERTARYLAALAAGLKRIGDNPAVGAVFGPEKPDLRRLRVGRHIIFYRDEAETVSVLRVLHERMEHLSRLGG